MAERKVIRVPKPGPNPDTVSGVDMEAEENRLEAHLRTTVTVLMDVLAGEPKHPSLQAAYNDVKSSLDDIQKAIDGGATDAVAVVGEVVSGGPGGGSGTP